VAELLSVGRAVFHLVAPAGAHLAGASATASALVSTVATAVCPSHQIPSPLTGHIPKADTPTRNPPGMQDGPPTNVPQRRRQWRDQSRRLYVPLSPPARLSAIKPTPTHGIQINPFPIPGGHRKSRRRIRLPPRRSDRPLPPDHHMPHYHPPRGGGPPRPSPLRRHRRVQPPAASRPVRRRDGRGPQPRRPGPPRGAGLVAADGVPRNRGVAQRR
jgi:hypothetical protein